MPTLRQSTATATLNCPRQGQYALDPNIRGTEGAATLQGTSYHAALERYYQDRMAGNVPVEPDDEYIIELMSLGETYMADTYQRCVETDMWRGDPPDFGVVERMVSAYFYGGHQWGAGFDVLGVEYLFTTPWFGDWSVRGAVDLILQSRIELRIGVVDIEPGDVVLVDHKTAGRKWPGGKGTDPAKGVQASWYHHWYRHMVEAEHGLVLPPERVHVFFDIITTKKLEFERRPAPRTQTDSDKVLERFAGVTKILELGQHVDLPGNTDSMFCGRDKCSYGYICPDVN